MNLGEFIAGAEIRVRHQTEGWTGTVYFESFGASSWGSYKQGFHLTATLRTDNTQDPNIEEASELEVLEIIYPERKTT